MIDRKLASVQVISKLEQIEGADNIELATVLGWQVVVKKGEFALGSKCVYFEIDSFLPIRPEYEFLRSSSYKMMGEEEGFRLKTIKLKGKISQGLALPYLGVEEVGTDLTHDLGIKKYEEPIHSSMNGSIKGYFPHFIPKTNEERVQNLDLEALKSVYQRFNVTEKLDGSSMTVYIRYGVLGVCSRNYELEETEDSIFWKLARTIDFLELDLNNIAIQGELIGPKIQGNPYKLAEHEFRPYTIFDIENQRRLSASHFYDICDLLRLKPVPLLFWNTTLPYLTALLEVADGKSNLNNKVNREGFVIRARDNNNVSFKVISNKFLLKQND
jgi:RNA ligase (TIGR02306 family)